MMQPHLPDSGSAPAEKGDADTVPSSHSADGDTEASSSAEAAPTGTPRRRPGRGWRIALLSVLAIFLVLTLATGGVALWVRHSIASGIETIANPFAGIATRAPQQSVPAGQEPATNILVLGTDSRTSASDPSQWEEGAQRTDAIMILQVSGDRKTVSVMSIPRDSWVDIPGHGQGKINAAYSYGGPSLTIHTVENLTGIHIDHFAVANFESFVALTDDIGGVRINLKTPQTIAGQEFGAGPQTLNGTQALAYTRERSSLPGGDFDRVKRQQTWMRSIVSRVLSNGTLSSPTQLYSFLKTATRTVAVDESFTINQMQSLALGTRNLHGNDIKFMTAPTTGTGTSADGQSIVLLDADADAPLFKAFAEDRVGAYLAEHPDAVELLPATVN